MELYSDYVVVTPVWSLTKNLDERKYNEYTLKANSLARIIDSIYDVQSSMMARGGYALRMNQPANVFHVYKSDDVAGRFAPYFGKPKVDNPIPIEISFENGLENINLLLRHVIGDDKIPDNILDSIVKGYDELVALSAGVFDKLNIKRVFAMEQLVAETFTEKAQQILDKYYTEENILKDVELFGRTAIITDTELVNQKIVLLARHPKLKIMRVFVKRRNDDMYRVLVVRGEPNGIVYVNESAMNDAPRGYGLLIDKPFNKFDEWTCAPLIESLEDARKIAQSLIDLGRDGKKKLKVSLKYDEDMGFFITDDGNYIINANPRMTYGDDDED